LKELVWFYPRERQEFFYKRLVVTLPDDDFEITQADIVGNPESGIYFAEKMPERAEMFTVQVKSRAIQVAYRRRGYFLHPIDNVFTEICVSPLDAIPE